MRTMFDAATCPVVIPAGVTVAAGYVGDAPPAAHTWAIDEWRRAANLPGVRELLPIGVYAPGRDGVNDARQHTGAAVVIAAACGFGAVSGCAVALDVEENVSAGSAGYVAPWAGEVRRLGFVPVVYTSRSAAGAIAGPVGLWLAEWTGQPHLVPGAVATQYASFPQLDLSLVVDELPLWSTRANTNGGDHVTGYTAIAQHPAGNGYWIAHASGGVFSYGAARFFGSMFGRPHAPITGIAPAADGNGYWLLGDDGGVFAFGSAKFYGSPAK